MIKSFDEFWSIKEFEKSDHYSNRINIVPELEKGKPRSEGSRILPLDETPFKTGYSITSIRNLDTERKLMYRTWLRENNINPEDFQKFLSDIWNFQMDNEIIEGKKGNPGIEYIIDPGKIVIKIGESHFELYYESEGKEKYMGNKFIILASGNTLITLKNASDEKRFSWEEELYQHNLRKRGNEFFDRYPNLQSFKKSIRIINLYKKDDNLIIDVDPSNLNSDAAIDTIKGYYGISTRSMSGSYIPDEIIKDLDPTERQIAVSVGIEMGTTKDKAEDPNEVFKFTITELVDPHYKKGNFNTKGGGYYTGGVKDFWKSGDYKSNDQISVKIKYEKPLKLIYNKGESNQREMIVENSNMIIKKGDYIWLPKGERGERVKVKIKGFLLDKRTENPLNLIYVETR